MNIFKEKFSILQKSTSHDYDNYKMLDITKYIVSVMVIYIHCNQGSNPLSQGWADYIIKNIVFRIAVPFFFITSAYFVRKGSIKNPRYVWVYLKSIIVSYLLWSLAFAPIGLDWTRQNLALSGNLLPLAFLYGLIHTGTYYHLWYIPAMLFSIFFANILLKRISYKVLFIISASLFVFGSIETYYGLLPAGVLKDYFDMLIKIVFTTRSGLLYGMVFVLMGFFICDYQEKLKSIIKYVPMLTLLFGIVLIAEGVLLYSIKRLDMNFLLGLIPFSFFFFLWVSSFPYKPKHDTRKARELSKYYYFIHPVCIVIIEQIGISYGISFLSAGFISFLLIVVLTHLLSICLIKQPKPLNFPRMIFPALCGLAIAFVFAAIILPFKTSAVTIRFEFVPCMWLASSFIMCYLLSRKRAKTATQCKQN